MSLPPLGNPDDQEFSEENEPTEQKQPPRSQVIIAGLTPDIDSRSLP